MDQKPIVYQLGGASKTGLSYWQQWASCPRRAAWREEERDLPEQRPPHFGERELWIGILYHAFVELYHEHAAPIDPELVIFIDQQNERLDLPGAIVNEAATLYRAYRGSFKPNHWGRVVGLEDVRPTTEEAAAKGLAEFGVSITARFDMIVEMSPTVAKRLAKKTFGIVAGRWIVDHKTARNFDPTIYHLGHQMPLYMMLDEFEGHEPKGALIIVGEKSSHRFHIVVLPLPTIERRMEVKNFLRGAAEIKRVLPTWANSTLGNCRFPRPCKYSRRCRYYYRGK